MLLINDVKQTRQLYESAEGSGLWSHLSPSVLIIFVRDKQEGGAVLQKYSPSYHPCEAMGLWEPCPSSWLLYFYCILRTGIMTWEITFFHAGLCHFVFVCAERAHTDEERLLLVSYIWSFLCHYTTPLLFFYKKKGSWNSGRGPFSEGGV